MKIITVLALVLTIVAFGQAIIPFDKDVSEIITDVQGPTMFVDTAYTDTAVVDTAVADTIDTDTTDVVDTDTVDTDAVDADTSIDVPLICQYPQLPTGCESVAATMVLQYFGEDISAQGFAGDWLECNSDFYTVNGTSYGPDPHKVFAGNPFSEYSYGCYAEPIVNAINRNSSMCTAEKITGKSLDELCTQYIDNDEPVLIWATMNMTESYKSNSWCLDDGSVFTWTAQEHCMVLVGYNDDCYILCDPMTGSTVAYEKWLVEQRFAELGNQAVYISPDKVKI